MPDETKYIGGPKSDETKAISSRNSITHGLTARKWINENEQELFNTTTEALIVDFDPETYIEKILITKMAECLVRLMRIQQVENAMFDLANSEAEHPNEVVKSLNNGNIEDPTLVAAIRSAYLNKPEFNIKAKTDLINEIISQNLESVSNWGYIEKHMPMVKAYTVNECAKKNISLYDFIFKKSDNSKSLTVIFIDPDKPLSHDPLSKEEITKDVNKIKPDALQRYLEWLTITLDNEIKIQVMVNSLEERSKQVKGAAMPDTQKLGLIKRYRTADERQFSKTLGELLELQKRRKESN